jgi:hypothetical protein
MKHPGEAELALFAGGDLGVPARWSVGIHVARCERCRDEVTAYRSGAEWLRGRADEMIPSLNWGSLAAEMKANIRLGFDAGEVVSPVVPKRGPLGWRAAAALAAVTVVVVSGWYMYVPRYLARTTADNGIVVAVRSEGVELKDGRSSMMLLHPVARQASDVAVTMDAEGTAGARYVDEQSGQVTINNVYAE